MNNKDNLAVLRDNAFLFPANADRILADPRMAMAVIDRCYFEHCLGAILDWWTRSPYAVMRSSEFDKVPEGTPCLIYEIRQTPRKYLSTNAMALTLRGEEVSTNCPPHPDIAFRSYKESRKRFTHLETPVDVMTMKQIADLLKAETNPEVNDLKSRIIIAEALTRVDHRNANWLMNETARLRHKILEMEKK